MAIPREPDEARARRVEYAAGLAVAVMAHPERQTRFTRRSSPGTGYDGERHMADAQQPLTGADLVVRRLRDYGVRVVFGYPGGQLTPLYDALHRDGGIRHVLA